MLVAIDEAGNGGVAAEVNQPGASIVPGNAVGRAHGRDRCDLATLDDDGGSDGVARVERDDLAVVQDQFVASTVLSARGQGERGGHGQERAKEEPLRQIIAQARLTRAPVPRVSNAAHILASTFARDLHAKDFDLGL